MAASGNVSSAAAMRTIESRVAEQNYDVSGLLHSPTESILYPHLYDEEDNVVPGFVRYFLTRWPKSNGFGSSSSAQGGGQPSRRITPELVHAGPPQNRSQEEEEKEEEEEEEDGAEEATENNDVIKETVSSAAQEKSVKKNLQLSQRFQETSDDLYKFYSSMYGASNEYIEELRANRIELLAWDQLVSIPRDQAPSIPSLSERSHVVIADDKYEGGSVSEELTYIAPYISQMASELREAEEADGNGVSVYEAVFYPIHMTEEVHPWYIMYPFHFLDEEDRRQRPFPEYVPPGFDPYEVEAVEEQVPIRRRRSRRPPEPYRPLFIRVRYSASTTGSPTTKEYIQDFMYDPQNNAWHAREFPQLYHHRRWGNTRSKDKVQPLWDAKRYVQDTILPRLRNTPGIERVQLVHAKMHETESTDDTSIPYETAVEAHSEESTPEETSFPSPPPPVPPSPEEEYEETESETESESEVEVLPADNNNNNNNNVIYVSDSDDDDDQIDTFTNVAVPNLLHSIDVYLQDSSPTDRMRWVNATKQSFQTVVSYAFERAGPSQGTDVTNARNALQDLLLSPSTDEGSSRKHQRVAGGGGGGESSSRVYIDDDLVGTLLQYSSRKDQETLLHRLVRAAQLCKTPIRQQLRLFTTYSRRSASADKITQAVNEFLARTFPTGSTHQGVDCTDIAYHLRELLQYMKQQQQQQQQKQKRRPRQETRTQIPKDVYSLRDRTAAEHVNKFLTHSSRPDVDDLFPRLVRAMKICPDTVGKRVRAINADFYYGMHWPRKMTYAVDHFLNQSFPRDSQARTKVVQCRDIDLSLQEIMQSLRKQ
jgi:hypothetical protein